MIPVVSPVIVAQRECPSCGQQVSGGYSSCPRCGAMPPKPARANQMVILGLLLLLIGGVAMFLMHS